MSALYENLKKKSISENLDGKLWFIFEYSKKGKAFPTFYREKCEKNTKKYI